MYKGKFISLEGIDGSGKTTLKEQLRIQLEGKYEFLMLREPGGTDISEKIRELLLDVRNEGILPRAEALLYAAARAQVVEEIIRPALKAGKLVVADRYLDSTIAYQGYGRGLDIDFLKQLNNLCTDGLKPDLTLLLDIEPAEGQRRRQKDILDRLEKEGLDFQTRVRNGYLKIQEEEPDRIKLLNGHLSVEELRREALQHIAPLLPTGPSRL